MLNILNNLSGFKPILPRRKSGRVAMTKSSVGSQWVAGETPFSRQN
jgi:hypothetical protein